MVDGVLVEKPAGFMESRLAIILGYLIESYLEQNRIGIVSVADGPVRLIVGLVRMPDVAFFSRGRLPGGQIPRDAIANVIPDLAVEVISRKNTAAEMRRKVREYFEAGVRLVWLVDGVVPLRGNHNRSDAAERRRYKTAPLARRAANIQRRPLRRRTPSAQASSSRVSFGLGGER